jgi:hypothetical protein
VSTGLSITKKRILLKYFKSYIVMKLINGFKEGIIWRVWSKIFVARACSPFQSCPRSSVLT